MVAPLDRSGGRSQYVTQARPTSHRPAHLVLQHSSKKVVQSGSLLTHLFVKVYRYGNYGAKGGEVCRTHAERLPADQNSNPRVLSYLKILPSHLSLETVMVKSMWPV